MHKERKAIDESKDVSIQCQTDAVMVEVETNKPSPDSPGKSDCLP